MFIYYKKSEFNNSVDYIWRIYLDDLHIGSAVIDISFVGPRENVLIIDLHRVAHMPESVIKAIAEDFKYLANNYLLDIEEDYEPFPHIEVRFGDEVFFY